MRRLVFIWLLTLAFGFLYGQPALELSLLEAKQMALKNNHLHKNELLEQQKTAFEIKQMNATRLPQISTSAGLIRNLIRPVTVLPGELDNRPGESIPVQFGTGWENTLSVDFYVSLFNPLTKQDLKLLALKGEKSLIQKQLLEEELQLQVTRSYYNILINKARLDQQQKGILRLQKSLSDTRAMVEAGLLHALEVERFQNAIHNTETMIHQLEQTVSLSSQTLNYYLGLPLEQEVILTEAILSEVTLRKMIPSATTPDVSQLTAYKLQHLVVEQAALNLIRQKKTVIPTFVFQGRLGTQALGNKLKYFDKEQRIPWYFSSYVGVGINWQFNSMWNNHHAIPIAQLELEQAKNLQEVEKQSLLMVHTQAKNEMENAVEFLDIAKSNLDFAKRELQYVQTRFEGELATGKELIEVENAVQSAQDEYWVATYQLIESKAALDKTVGKK